MWKPLIATYCIKHLCYNKPNVGKGRAMGIQEEATTYPDSSKTFLAIGTWEKFAPWFINIRKKKQYLVKGTKNWHRLPKKKEHDTVTKGARSSLTCQSLLIFFFFFFIFGHSKVNKSKELLVLTCPHLFTFLLIYCHRLITFLPFNFIFFI